MRLIFSWLLLLIGIVTLTNGQQFQYGIDDLDDEPIDMSLAGQYKNLSDSSLLWGPYRSGLYFGVRPRIPRSLLSGLMWFNVDDYQGISKLRHFYEQNDPMKKANWVYYDPRLGGRQVIIDKENHIKLTIDFLKSTDGKSWAVKVKCKPQKGFEDVKTSFIWYSGLESEVVEEDIFGQEKVSGALNLDSIKDPYGSYSDPVKLRGISEELGLFTLTIGNGPSSNRRPEATFKDPELDPSKNHHLSMRVPNDQIWQARDIYMTLLQDSFKELVERYEKAPIPTEQSFLLRDLNHFEGNLHIVQQTYIGECQFDVIYDNAFTPESEKVTSENFNTKFEALLKKFNYKFENTFKLNKPFDTKEYEPFAKEILSGLLGGASYFYGNHIVDRETKFDEESFETYELNGKLEGPHELFTLVPSRPFFPRGFLWDEGFHLLPLLEYDSDLVLEITKSWFNLIDEDGWIAREQILGPELRSRVPKEFTHQSPEIVNPPTLMMVFTYLLESLKSSDFGDVDEPINVEDYGVFLDSNQLGSIIMSNPEVLTNYAREIYPMLKAHYNMFRRTQKGFSGDFDRSDDMEAYRWRGRTSTHCLASGLDDYPRALPADIAELNVDLLSWIGTMTRSMKLIAETIGEKEDAIKYQDIESNIINSLDTIHWSEEKGTYCDVSVDEDDEEFHACFKGYISLFPFLTKLMRPDSSSKLEKIIEMISNPEELWTDFGIRSLSKSDEFYKTGEDYWRSPIWININYLILDSLKYYKENGQLTPTLQEKISTTYHDLRLNLVNNIFKEWKRTGFVWEQYNDETGTAQGAKNFLGWTSTVILMMKMPENI